MVGVDVTRFCLVPLELTPSWWMFVLIPGRGGRGGGAPSVVVVGARIGSSALTGGRAGSAGRCSPVNWGDMGVLAWPFTSSRLLLTTEWWTGGGSNPTWKVFALPNPSVSCDPCD